MGGGRGGRGPSVGRLQSEVEDMEKAMSGRMTRRGPEEMIGSLALLLAFPAGKFLNISPPSPAAILDSHSGVSLAAEEAKKMVAAQHENSEKYK